MVATGVFYGQTQSNYIADIMASVISSLIGTLPVKIVRILFEKSKPRVERSTLTTSDGKMMVREVFTLNDGAQAAMQKEDEDETHSEDIYGTQAGAKETNGAAPGSAPGAGGEHNGAEGQTEIAGGKGLEDDTRTEEEKEKERKKELKEMIINGADDITIDEFKKRLDELYPGETKEYKLRAIRQVVFEDMYPLPHWTRYGQTMVSLLKMFPLRHVVSW